MKINILFETRDGPWGGGNQFLKALKNELIRTGVYTDDIACADCLLFNSFQNIKTVLTLKKQYPNKIFVHRVDGPIALVRGTTSRATDKFIFKVNEKIADGTVFQSKWCIDKSKEFGLKSNIFEAVIHNAPDNSLFFNTKTGRYLPNDKKIKLIATSWSDNMNKGYAYYKYLDQNLDFSRFEMSFIGRSPIDFKNIKYLGRLYSKQIAEIYKESDIYITATKDEPCSNALIEALASGLPAVYLNSGGNPELVQNGGVSFNNDSEIIARIEDVCMNYKNYVDNLPTFRIQEVAQQYVDFCSQIIYATLSNGYVAKKINYKDLVMLRIKNIWK